MSRVWLVGLVLVFLVACSSEVVEEQVVERSEEAVKPADVVISEEVVEEEGLVAPVVELPKKVVVPPTPPAPATPAVIVEKTGLMVPELRDLLSRADRKVKSYSYMYTVSADNHFPHQYFIKGQYVKIKLFELEPYFIENYYDHVYLDTKNKKAYGYCESRKKCISGKYDNTKRVFNVSYEEYRIKTPYEFLKAITFAEIIGPELIENRNVIKIRQIEGDIVTNLWIDDAFGLPRRVLVSQDEKVIASYTFADMQFNTLKDEEVWRGPN